MNIPVGGYILEEDDYNVGLVINDVKKYIKYGNNSTEINPRRQILIGAKNINYANILIGQINLLKLATRVEEMEIKYEIGPVLVNYLPLDNMNIVIQYYKEFFI